MLWKSCEAWGWVLLYGKVTGGQALQGMLTEAVRGLGVTCPLGGLLRFFSQYCLLAVEVARSVWEEVAGSL